MADTREEHVEWCKQRAYKEMEFYKDPHKGIISLLSDLRKHPETVNHPAIQLGALLMLTGNIDSIGAARKFIDGCR